MGGGGEGMHACVSVWCVCAYGVCACAFVGVYVCAHVINTARLCYAMLRLVQQGWPEPHEPRKHTHRKHQGNKHTLGHKHT